MIARYLPPDTGDGAPGDSGDEPQRAAEPSRSTARVEVSGDTEPEEVEAVESPEAVEPPEPVGSGADWIRDVSWVYQQYSRVVVLEPGKPPRCHFARATTPVPSGGARGLMEWAATNRTAFYNLAGKYLSQEGTEDEDARVKRDELKADKVREVLKRFLEVKAERAKDEWI